MDQVTYDGVAALSRNRTVIEINFNRYPDRYIPGFLDWVTTNGIGPYQINRSYVSFSSDIDADIFWLAFRGKPVRRCMYMLSGVTYLLSIETDDCRKWATRINLPVMTTKNPDYDGVTLYD